MPHVDLHQAFSSPDQGDSTTCQLSPPEHGTLNRPPLGSRRLAAVAFAHRFTGSQLTNILFVTVTFLGGLFCAFYFFNGAELLRAAAAWPREFLYPRPAAAEKQKVLNRPSFPGEETGPFAENYRFSLAPSHNPFSRTAGGPTWSPFSPGVSNVPTTGSLPSGGPGSNPSSLLGDLNLLPPGGDALVQALFQGAARTADLDARRTVVVITTPVSKTRQAASARVKNIVKESANAGMNSTGHTNKSIGQTATTALPSQGSSATILQPINTGRSLTNVPQNMTAAGRGLSSSSLSRVGSMTSRVGSIGGGRRR
jgi:hypothetical protein